MTVDIIIPFYNQSSLFEKCLTSTLATVTGARVVVIDDSVDMIERAECIRICEMHGVERLENEANLGFIGATKRGADSGDSEFILFLNSDIIALEWGWLDAMLEPMQSKRVAIVGAKLLFPDGRIQHAGVGRVDGGWPFHPFMGEPGHMPAANVYREINAVTGGCFLIRRSVWNDLGGWDAGFGRGVFEDVDLCWRARRDRMKVVYQPKAQLTHYQSASVEADGTHSLHAHSKANGEYLRRKWGSMHGDEHLFGLPRMAVQANDAPAALPSGRIYINQKLNPVWARAQAGDPDAGRAANWLGLILKNLNQQEQISFQEGMFAMFAELGK